MAKAKEELDFQDKFDYIIINDNLSDACEKAFNLAKDFLNKWKKLVCFLALSIPFILAIRLLEPICKKIQI